jgi:hypothetical protein
MTKHIAPHIMSTIELPPIDEADAKARAAREANAKAFFESYEFPPDFDHESLHDLMARFDANATTFDAFILEAAITGDLDRPRFRELYAEQGRLRREFLILVGTDPNSDDIMERPVEMNHF